MGGGGRSDEVETEVIECLLRVPEFSLLAPTLQEASGATGEFVDDQAADQIQGAMDSVWA